MGECWWSSWKFMVQVRVERRISRHYWIQMLRLCQQVSISLHLSSNSFHRLCFQSKLLLNGHTDRYYQHQAYRLSTQQPRKKENASFLKLQPKFTGSNWSDLVYTPTPEPITKDMLQERYYCHHSQMVFPPLKRGAVNLT